MERTADGAATEILVHIVGRYGSTMTPEITLALVRKLCHIAGGDGRGVYSVSHDPTGDRIP